MAEKMKKGENSTDEQTTVETAEKWIITVKNNLNFVGKGAGGVQFANGRAETEKKVLADWFKEHDGYEVKKC